MRGWVRDVLGTTAPGHPEPCPCPREPRSGRDSKGGLTSAADMARYAYDIFFRPVSLVLSNAARESMLLGRFPTSSASTPKQALGGLYGTMVRRTRQVSATSVECTFERFVSCL